MNHKFVSKIGAVLLLMSGGLTAPHAGAQLAMEQALREKCPEGFYGGPQPGRTRFTKDPYTWFVTREFAKRFCMPESMIDDSLKGALAIAVRVKDDEEVSCGLIAGRSDICPFTKKLVVEIYVEKKANIPKADPSVEFYIRRDFNSGRLTGRDVIKANQRSMGTYVDAVGEKGAFNPAHSKTIDAKSWTHFLYVGVRNGWASGNGNFFENYYRANWAEGIDLIGLTRPSSVGFPTSPERRALYAREEPFQDDPVRSHAIVVLRGDPPNLLLGPIQNRYDDFRKLRYPEDYLHVIEVPPGFAQRMDDFAKKTGDGFTQDLQRAITLSPANR